MAKQAGRGSGGCLRVVIIVVVVVVGLNLLTGGELFEAFAEVLSGGSTSDRRNEYSAPPVEEPAAVPVSFEPVSFERQPYYPIKDCAHSRLYVGDRAIVSLGGSSNGIRTEPDTHPSDNIIYRAPSGEGLWIIDGPECNYGWILWKVQTDSGHVGWTPESKGGEFWLTPIESDSDMLAVIQSDPHTYEVYERVSSTIHDQTMSESQKREQMRVYQSTYGEEIVTTVLRYVPVYEGDGSFVSFDNWMRDFSSSTGSSSSNAPIDQDPVGASMSIFFDPSPENITEQLGLGDWFP